MALRELMRVSTAKAAQAALNAAGPGALQGEAVAGASGAAAAAGVGGEVGGAGV
jgi:hypothetical protein